MVTFFSVNALAGRGVEIPQPDPSLEELPPTVELIRVIVP